jgi:hypothetical protein
MKRFLILIILFSLAFIHESSAQKRKTERAYSAFNAGEYFEAIDQFKDTYSKTSKSDKANATKIN